MTDVRVRFSKWGDRPHWQCAATRLGEDGYGVWLGLPVGTHMSRPGASFVTDELQVMLVPPRGAFIATFSQGCRSAPFEVYVDITTIPAWDGDTLRAVDLDLDVIRGRTGRVWVDDEDEFADHRVRFGYPDEVVRLAVTSCAEVLAAVHSRLPPYDGVVGAAWINRLDAAMMDR